jgi:hypothetical protein
MILIFIIYDIQTYNLWYWDLYVILLRLICYACTWETCLWVILILKLIWYFGTCMSNLF